MERFDPLRAAGVALALAGAAVLALAKLRAPDASTVWVLATFVGPVLLAIGNLYRSHHWPKGARPDTLAPGMLGAAAAMLLAGLLPGLDLAVPLRGPTAIVLVLIQTMVFSLQYLLFFTLQKRGGPVYLSCSARWAPPAGLGIRGVLIALGIALVTSGGAKQEPEEAA